MIFSDTIWNKLVTTTAEAYSMDPTERERLLQSTAAKIVGSLPFLAGCAKPERVALSHLAVFVLASRGNARQVFDHAPEDDRDPLVRLEPISHFPGGDPAVVRKGMALLGLLMLGGYDKDRKKDAKSGEYNPLNAGAWKKEEIAARLRAEANSTKVQELDDLTTTDEAVRGFWDE